MSRDIIQLQLPGCKSINIHRRCF